jgi:predicted nucleotidyltransferase
MSDSGPLEHSIGEYAPALARVFERRGVLLAYLYGSQARGDAGPLSDVDVGVLFQPGLDPRERWHRRLALGQDLMCVFRRDDLVVADLAEASPLLKNEVRREGRLLYCADEAVRVEFEVGALREFVDTQSLRDLRRQYLLERIDQGRMGQYAQP